MFPLPDLGVSADSVFSMLSDVFVGFLSRSLLALVAKRAQSTVDSVPLHAPSLQPSPASLRPEDEGDPSAAAARRNQTTAVILCGVLGALFDLEQERAASRAAHTPALNTALTRHTAKALMYLVLAPADANMPRYTQAASVTALTALTALTAHLDCPPATHP